MLTRFRPKRTALAKKQPRGKKPRGSVSKNSPGSETESAVTAGEVEAAAAVVTSIVAHRGTQGRHPDVDVTMTTFADHHAAPIPISQAEHATTYHHRAALPHRTVAR